LDKRKTAAAAPFFESDFIADHFVAGHDFDRDLRLRIYRDHGLGFALQLAP